MVDWYLSNQSQEGTIQVLSNQIHRGLQQVNLHMTQTGFCKITPKVDMKQKVIAIKQKSYTNINCTRHTSKNIVEQK